MVSHGGQSWIKDLVFDSLKGHAILEELSNVIVLERQDGPVRPRIKF